MDKTMTEQNIADENKVNKNIVYHYCSLETFQKIISSKTFRLCNALKSNDREEFKCFLEVLEKTLPNKEALNVITSKITATKDFLYTPYIMCFSKDGDKLSQWRGYADNGRGVAIGVDLGKVEYLKKDSLKINDDKSYPFEHIDITSDRLIEECMKAGEKDPLGDQWLNPFYIDVIYDKDIQEKILRGLLIDKNIEILKHYAKNPSSSQNTEVESLLQAIYICGIAFKHKSFEEEQEVRIVYMRKEFSNAQPLPSFDCFVRNANLVGFYELTIKNIGDVIKYLILGPRCKLTVSDKELEKFLCMNKIDSNGKLGMCRENLEEVVADEGCKILPSDIPYIG